MRPLSVAIVGATGMIGQEFIRVLEQHRFPLGQVQLFSSDRTAGKKLFVNHKEVDVQEVSSRSFEHVDLAFFAPGAEVSRHFSPIAAKAGAVVIDTSSAFRMEPWVPLVIPEVNPQDLKDHKGIIANPDSSTIQMVAALYPLHKINPLRRIIVSTYQSVSGGTGSAAMEELTIQTKQILEGRSTTPHAYPHQIAFNVLPEIDVFLYNGYTKEEWKMMEETRKIMHTPELGVSATCVRVPVYICHSESITVEFTNPITPEDAKKVLSQSPGIRLLDDPDISLYPMPWSVAGTDEVCVGRIRRDVSHPNALVMWVVADNIRKGAALNAVQIAEILLLKGWMKVA
ncbi:MAG: aspartate-semialdehyde dehydrogenase [Dehalococcoidia bacterium]|nr:aspartate-semialdehyde dehydrogenase [Dehalococcoidia bacterium]MBF8303792.1 aspartate-semialdehyde dehydrogenase [Dehalococcoidia bacterium]